MQVLQDRKNIHPLHVAQCTYELRFHCRDSKIETAEIIKIVLPELFSSDQNSKPGCFGIRVRIRVSNAKISQRKVEKENG